MSTSPTPPHRSSRGEYAKTARRKAEIILAAKTVFAEKGYNGGSLRQIAKLLGLSLTSIVHHFPTKSELLLAILDSTDREGIESFPDLHSRGVAPTVLRVVERNLERPELLRVLVILSAEATAPDHPARAWFVERYADLIDTLAKSIANDQDRGWLSSTRDPEFLAQALIAGWDGMQLQWLLNPTFDIVAAMELFVAGLLCPTPRPEPETR